MDSDIDDDAILLDRALNGVCYNDLKYLMREFGVELPPDAEKQPRDRGRHQRGIESGNVIATSEDNQLNCDQVSVLGQDSLSESSIDEDQENVPSPDGDNSGFERSKCAGCDSPKHYNKIYGINLCSACHKFMQRMVKQKFKTSCTGEGNCRTTYSDGDPIKCQSCRLRNMMKLDIRHPAWVNYKAKHEVESEDFDSSSLQDDEPGSDNDHEDQDSMTSDDDNSSSGDDSSSISSVHEQDESEVSSSSDQCDSEQFNCASCDAPGQEKRYGINLCIACLSFIKRVARRKFEVHCEGGSGNCRVTYKAGQRIRCSSCRLENMIKLDIRHPGWVRYKREQGHKIGNNHARPDDGSMSEESHNSDDDGDGDGESTRSSNSYLEESGDSEPEQERGITAFDRGQSGCQQIKCTGCGASTRLKLYGLNLCCSCQAFISMIARKNFQATCLGGQSNCRTTFKLGEKILCSYCRLKKLMKLDIRHHAWLKYRAKNGSKIITMHQDGENALNYLHDSKDDDHEDGEGATSINCDSVNEGESLATPNRDRTHFGRFECASCGNPEQYVLIYGINLCTGCRKFIVKLAERNFKTTCITGRGNCRTTFSDRQPILCQSCRFRNMLQLDIRNPAWIRYKEEHGIRTEPSLDEELDSGDHQVGESRLSTDDNSGDKSSCIDGQEESVTLQNHDRAGSTKQPNCSGCNNPRIYAKVYGLHLCCGCWLFIARMRRKNFDVSCSGGQNRCRTTFRLGSPIKCQSCRLRKFMKLNIRNPAWVAYRENHWIESQFPDNPEQHDEEEPHLDGADDGARESTLLSQVDIGDKELNNRESRLDRLGQSGLERVECASCGAPYKFTFYGVNLCNACQVFAVKIAKDNFIASCIDGRANCRTTYQIGLRIRCSSCRLKKMLNLDIRHPAWIEYRATHGFETAGNLTRQDGANLLKKRYATPRSSYNIGRKRCVAPLNLDQRPGCVGCNAPTKSKCYGLDLCDGCQMFIYYVAEKKIFGAQCCEGQGNCRTTHIAGNLMKCPSCRIKKLMKLEIRHHAWVDYKAKHGFSEGNDETNVMTLSHNNSSIEKIDEATVQIANKPCIGLGEDCDANDEIKVMDVDCD